MEETAAWLDDPIHPSEDVYGRLADLAVMLCTRAGDTTTTSPLRAIPHDSPHYRQHFRQHLPLAPIRMEVIYCKIQS
jgi:hypothetical protein